MVEHTLPADICPAASSPDDILIGKSEQDTSTPLSGCLWRVSKWDGKVLPSTMDYRGERRNLDIQDDRVIWI